MFSALRDEGVTKGDIANELRVSTEEIDWLVFGLTLTAFSGTVASGGTFNRKRAQLRVVN